MKTSTVSEHLFQIITTLLLTLFMISCLYPFYYILIYSLSEPGEVVRHNPYFFPSHFTLSNYLQVLKLQGIYHAAEISVARVALGTAVTVFFSAMLAYSLTKKITPGRTFFYRVAIISMYVNAGLIPWYIVMINLGMKNNFLLYILPSAVTPFFLILIKTFMEQLPPALEESAKIDGAGVFMIFLRIVFPLSKPILAAVAVFSAVNQWNSWSDNFFLVNHPNLQTLQLTLLNFLRQAEAIAEQAKVGASVQNLKYTLTPLSIKMTLTMIVSFPIIVVYPFMQRYFVKGMLLGAVKG